jgi:hypothetical protein
MWSEECWFCEKRADNNECVFEVVMIKDTAITTRKKYFQKAELLFPRCKECMGVHIAARLIAYLILLLSVFLGFAPLGGNILIHNWLFVISVVSIFFSIRFFYPKFRGVKNSELLGDIRRDARVRDLLKRYFYFPILKMLL